MTDEELFEWLDACPTQWCLSTDPAKGTITVTLTEEKEKEKIDASK